MRQSTAFNSRITSGINNAIDALAAKVNRSIVNPNVPLDAVRRLIVKPEHQDFVVDALKIYAHSNVCWAKITLPPKSVHGELINQHTSVVINWTPDKENSFAAPSYAQRNELPKGAAEELLAQLYEVLGPWRANAIEMGLVKDMFARLNDKYAKDPQHVQYLFPGILPLLQLADQRELAAKLAVSRASTEWGSITPDFRNQLVRANQIVAKAMLYPEVTTPAATRQEATIRAEGYSVMLPGWPGSVYPLFGL